MQLTTWRKQAIGFCAALVVGLAIAGCANNPRPEDLANNKGGVAAPGSPRDFAVNAGDLVYFSTDSVDLSPEAQQTVANQARWLKQYSHYTITIEGHADGVAVHLTLLLLRMATLLHGDGHASSPLRRPRTLDASRRRLRWVGLGHGRHCWPSSAAGGMYSVS